MATSEDFASADNLSSGTEQKENKSQANTLIALAKKNGASLFRTPDGDGYVDIIVNRHRETWPLRSSGFRKWLRRIYFFELEAAPRKEAIETAVETLDAEAQFSCDTVHPGELRVAPGHDLLRLVQRQVGGRRDRGHGLEDRHQRARSLPLYQHVPAAGCTRQGWEARRGALVLKSQ